MPFSSPISNTYCPKVAKTLKSIDAAIILYHFQFWIKINSENGRNFHNGKFWTFQTYQQIAKKFVHLSVEQIRRLIKKLVKHGYLIIGNFNKKRFDKTNWYSLADEHYNKLFDKFKQVVKEKIEDIKENIQEKINVMKDKIDTGYLKVKSVIKNIFTSVDFDTSSVDFATPIPDNKTTYIHKKEKKQKKAALSEPSPTALELSSFFYESLKKNVLPKLEKPNLKKWGRDIDAILKTYTPEEVKNIIIFSTTSNSWWVGTIVDSKGLKKHFNRLVGDRSKELKKAQPKNQEVDIETIEARKHWARSEISKNWSNFKREEKPRAQVEFVEFGKEKLYYKDLKFDELFKHNMRKWLF